MASPNFATVSQLLSTPPGFTQDLITNDSLDGSFSTIMSSQSSPTTSIPEMQSQTGDASPANSQTVNLQVPAQSHTGQSGVSPPTHTPTNSPNEPPQASGVPTRRRSKRRLARSQPARPSTVISKPRRGRPRKTAQASQGANKPQDPTSSHPIDLLTVMNMVRDLNESVKNLNNMQKTNEDLVKQLARITADKEELHRENAALRKQLSNASTMPNNTLPSLLIGSSIVRDVDSTKLVNTEVKCLRGGTISDVHKTLSSGDTNYNTIYLQVGSNDCARGNDVNLICEDYKLLLAGAKQRSKDIIVSSVTPRMDDSDAQSKIEQLNGFLLCHCSDEKVTFIDNDKIFKLQDGSINDGFLAADHLHLSDSGTNRLLKNLNISTKASDITLPKNKRAPPKRTTQRPQQSTQKTPPSPYDSDANNTPQHPPQHTTRPWNNRRPTSNGYINTSKAKQHNAYKPTTHNNNAINNTIKCKKCGEPGHLVTTCWHPATVRCHLCKELGHKQSLCPRPLQQSDSNMNGSKTDNYPRVKPQSLLQHKNSYPFNGPSYESFNRFSVLS
ncbi:unnamed protein product [Owenia fusiformis]|uniref:CCHC-type domain-containing protein n=1 Tax=Owenia fusiformis TaxID=6347 RepID=A0A8S4PR07_OWEFU|nr:unnamed protein product [Owenia fusiformis]